MKPLLILFSVLLATGCTLPATVSLPPPVPSAVGPAGVEVSGRVGTSTLLRTRASATVTARPVDNLSVYASGLVARRDSSTDQESNALFASVYEYGEVGVMSAFPLRERVWLTAGLARGRGSVESEGSVVGDCGFFTCTTNRYLVRADVSRMSGDLGLYLENPDGVDFTFGFRLARASFTNIERDRATSLPDGDFEVWVAEPSFGTRFDLPVGTFDFQMVWGDFLGDVPTAPEVSQQRRIYESEKVSMTLGVTLDVQKVLGVR